MNGTINRRDFVRLLAAGSAGLIPTLQQMEENMLRFAMNSCGGNISAAARQLGIPRQTLQHKLKRYNITSSTV